MHDVLLSVTLGFLRDTARSGLQLSCGPRHFTLKPSFGLHQRVVQIKVHLGFRVYCSLWFWNQGPGPALRFARDEYTSKDRRPFVVRILVRLFCTSSWVRNYQLQRGSGAVRAGNIAWSARVASAWTCRGDSTYQKGVDSWQWAQRLENPFNYGILLPEMITGVIF